MDYLQTDTKKLYFKFLLPSMMSALVASIYFFVDAIAVGQSEGALGTAAVASVIGTSVQCVIMASHFFRKTCKLKLIRPHNCLHGFRKILQIGIGASALNLGTVTIGMMINNQIARYGGTTELAVFGVMSTLMSLFFALYAGVGQAVQPIVSTNYGAKQSERIKAIWRLSFITVLIMGALFTIIGELFPIPITKFFMNATRRCWEQHREYSDCSSRCSCFSVSRYLQIIICNQ